MFNQIAGYSIAQADIVRRVMGSKNLEQMAIERELFIHGKDEKLGKYILTEKGLVEAKFSKLVEYDFIPTYTEIHGKLVNTNNGTVAKTISGEYVDVSKYMDESRQVLDAITRYNEDGTINKEVKTLVPGATRFKALLGSEAIEKFTNREAGEYRLNVKQVGQYITKEKVIFVDVSSDGTVHSLDYDLNPNNKGAEIDKLISSQASYEIEFSKINMNLATAEKLMRDMESFASYAFNKSHGVAYAYIAYRSAYLKTHFPVEYNVALLSSMIGKDKTRFHHYMNSCKKETGIEILGPDINKSGELFTPDDSKIVFGLSGIKHVGKKVTPRIIEERKIRGKFTSLYDFISRMKASSGVNKSEVESLIKAGAFDSLGNNRKELLSAYEEILKGATRKTVNENQVSLLDYLDSEQKKLFGGGEIAKMSELSQSELLSLELEVVGMYVSAHPLEGYSKAIELSGVSTLTEIKASIENEDGQFKDDQFINIPIVITSCKERSTRTGTQMMNLQVQDEIADSRGVLFEKTLNEFRDKLVPGYTAIANGKLQIGDDGSTDIMFFKFYDMPTNQEVQKLIDSNQQNVLNSMLKPYKEYRTSKTDYTKTPKPIVKETVNYKVVESRKMREGAYVSIKSSADIRDLVEIVKDSPGRTQLYAHIEETNNYVALSNRSINSDDNDLLNSLHDFSNKGLILVKRANV